MLNYYRKLYGRSDLYLILLWSTLERVGFYFCGARVFLIQCFIQKLWVSVIFWFVSYLMKCFYVIFDLIFIWAEFVGFSHLLVQFLKKIKKVKIFQYIALRFAIIMMSSSAFKIRSVLNSFLLQISTTTTYYVFFLNNVVLEKLVTSKLFCVSVSLWHKTL